MLAAIVMRAMQRAVDGAPQSLLVQYPRAPAAGPATVTVSVDRAGRRASQLSASLVQGERECVRALATFVSGFPAAEDDWDEPLPTMAALADAPVSSRQPWWPSFTRILGYRIVLGGEPFGGGDALTGGWVSTVPPRPLDAPFLAYLADAWFPSAFVRLRTTALVPTLDLSVHFLADLREPLDVAAVAARFATPTARRGLLVEDGTFWAPDGTVLAHSRQSALRTAIPFPA